MKSRTRVLAELSAQHTMLRGMMERCEELADELDAGRMGPLQLEREVERLRLAVEAHDRFEEQVVHPMVLAAGVIEMHVAKHRAMRARLGPTATRELRAVIADLRAHLSEEERYFVMAQPVRHVAS